MTRILPKNTTQQAVRKLTLRLLALAVAMFAFGFALIPMYSVFCKVTGLNGKTGGAVALNPADTIDKSRTITVQFLASTNAYLPWDFYPLQTSVKLHPGEVTRVAYYARNNSTKTMTVQAIPSVTPGLAARYVRKTECFCFTRQTFKAGEAQRMPVLFHLDKELPKNITTLTLAYTMFDAEKFTSRPTKEQGRIH